MAEARLDFDNEVGLADPGVQRANQAARGGKQMSLSPAFDEAKLEAKKAVRSVRHSTRHVAAVEPDAPAETVPAPQPLWLAIHLPYLGLELFHRRASVADPNKPTVLLDDNRIIVRNRAARQLRIAVGSSLATAHSISPDLTHYNRDPEGEQSRLDFLAQALYRFTPQVSTSDPLCLMLEVRGSIRLFGGLEPLIRQVLDVLRAFGHYGRPGAAETPLAAQALSLFRDIDSIDIDRPTTGSWRGGRYFVMCR